MTRRRAIVAGACAALALLGAWRATRPSESKPPPVTETPPAAPEATPAAPPPSAASPGAPLEVAPEPGLASVRAASLDPSADGARLLMQALDGSDPVAKLEAIDALVERRHLPALAPLLRFTPADDPYLAPTVLVGLGELGGHAPPPERRAVLDRLLALLREEKTRGGADSAGNVITIVESIGRLGDPGGASALERELADPFHDVTNQTAIVKSIGLLGQRSSVDALERFRAGLDLGKTADPFERELESDLVSTLDGVSTRLRGG